MFACFQIKFLWFVKIGVTGKENILTLVPLRSIGVDGKFQKSLYIVGRGALTLLFYEDPACIVSLPFSNPVLPSPPPPPHTHTHVSFAQ